MRFRKIELTRYGPFEDVALDIDAARPVTVIYGRNEAGKSSLLKALSDLLFGFPAQAGYASFRHDYNKLRLGGSIEAEIDGALDLLTFQRLKKAKGALRDADGALLTETALEPFLGPIDRSAFEDLFALDADRLRQGGEKLLTSGGALGESLLSAGAALGDIHMRRQNYDAAADKIFAKRKSGDRRFYAALERREAARKALKEVGLTARRLSEADEELRKTRERRQEAEEKLRTQSQERGRDKRVCAAAKIAPELDRLRNELHAVGPAPAVEALAAGRAALTQLEETRQRTNAALERTTEARLELEAESEPGPELTEAAAIGELMAAAKAERDRRKDAQRLASERAALGERMEHLARRLGAPADALRDLLPSDAQINAALAEAMQLPNLRARAADAQSELREAEEAAATAQHTKDMVRGADVTALRSKRDAAWAALRADIEGDRSPDAARLDGQEALTSQADMAADAQIETAGAQGKAAGQAQAAQQRRAKAEQSAQTAVAALAAAEEQAQTLGAALLPENAAFSGPALDKAISAAAEGWRAAGRLFETEAELTEREAALSQSDAELAGQAAAIAERLNAPTPDDPHLAAREWGAALKTAENAQERRRTLTRALRGETQRLERARADQEAAKADLDEAADRLGVAGPSGVAVALEQADAREKLSAALTAAEREWTQAADGVEEAALRRDIQEMDLDAAMARLEAGEALWQAAQEENNAAVAAEAKAEAARRMLETDQGAAHLAREEEDAAAEMRFAAEEWLTLRAASLLLGETARRYREQAANPVLTAASRAFQTLTVGRFEGLAVDYDDHGAERIVAVRSEDNQSPGERVGTAGLSEGACDQLYLALRLGAIERWAKDRPTAPFIADDLFASFDEERLGAGLEVLAAFGATAQCIILTHHRHVVEMAAARLGKQASIIEI